MKNYFVKLFGILVDNLTEYYKGDKNLIKWKIQTFHIPLILIQINSLVLKINS